GLTRPDLRVNSPKRSTPLSMANFKNSRSRAVMVCWDMQESVRV
ncbi:uncharacterized protein METZ01_LOCUS310272, partial [marine metagenome]